MADVLSYYSEILNALGNNTIFESEGDGSSASHSGYSRDGRDGRRPEPFGFIGGMVESAPALPQSAVGLMDRERGGYARTCLELSFEETNDVKYV